MKLHVHIHFTNPDPFPRYKYFPYMLNCIPKALIADIYIFLGPLGWKYPC